MNDPLPYCPIDVTARVQYLADQSQPGNSRFAFAYHITIANHGSEPAQLISRHWIITDANEARQEVQGIGVVGQQPTILPGDAYRYTSGVVLDTEVGTMEGSYRMLGNDGAMFDAPIRPFLLAAPGVLH